MFHFNASGLTHLLATYGYWALLLFVAIESTGIPFPGETMLLVAAIAAGTTHQLSIAFVIMAAASGAILGDNLGFWVGREGGYYGRYVRLEERRLKLGRYLFLKHGGKVVFFGRFVAVLRAWAAFLAGTNRMRWPRSSSSRPSSSCAATNSVWRTRRSGPCQVHSTPTSRERNIRDRHSPGRKPLDATAGSGASKGEARCCLLETSRDAVALPATSPEREGSRKVAQDRV